MKIFVLLFSDKCWWKEGALQIWQIAPKSLLQVVRINQFEKFFRRIIPTHDKLLDSQWVYHLFHYFPNEFHRPFGVKNMQAIKSSLEQCLKRSGYGCNQLIGQVSYSDPLHVNNCYPVLNSPRNQDPSD